MSETCKHCGLGAADGLPLFPADPIAVEIYGGEHWLHRHRYDCIAAIRALEAKVRELESVRSEQARLCNVMTAERNIFKNAWDKARADRDRRAAEVAMLKTECDVFAKAAGENLGIANALRADSDRLAAEVERLQGGVEFWRGSHTKVAAEVARLQARIADAYGWLWCVNHEPGTPHQFSAEQAAYNARKLLRDLLTHEQRGVGINKAVSAARRAGEGEG